MLVRLVGADDLHRDPIANPQALVAEPPKVLVFRSFGSSRQTADGQPQVYTASPADSWRGGLSQLAYGVHYGVKYA